MWIWKRKNSKTVALPLTVGHIRLVNVWTARMRGMVGACSLTMTLTLITLWLAEQADRLFRAGYCYERRRWWADISNIASLLEIIWIGENVAVVSHTMWIAMLILVLILRIGAVDLVLSWSLSHWKVSFVKSDDLYLQDDLPIGGYIINWDLIDKRRLTW